LGCFVKFFIALFTVLGEKRLNNMGEKYNFRGILSLSAASVALLQSTPLARGELSESLNDSQSTPNGQITSKTEKLLLAPPQHDAMLKLYAGHSSHASHSSHVSGAGGYSTPATPVVPYYVPSAPPVAPPARPVIPQPKPTPIAPVKTAAPQVSTNTTSSTNVLSSEDVAKNKEHLESLTKKAAEGSDYAQYSLGICYLYGSDGAERNVDKAKMLLELSAIQGNAFAKERLAELTPDMKKPEAP